VKATALPPLPVFADRAAPSEAGLAAIAARAVWVRGPVWDAVWMQSALWLAPIALWLSLGHADPEASPLDVLYFGLTALFWIGHRLCSTWLAYGTEAYRPLLRAQPVRFVVLPLLVAAACFAVVLPPAGDREARLVALAIVDYVFVTWHFAAQHFGALSLYRMRAGRGACARTRRLDRWFALGIGGVLVLVADLLAGAVAFQDRWVGAWLGAERIAAAQDDVRAAATLVLLLATAGMLAAELGAARPSLPRLLYVVGIAGMVAVALQPRGPFLFLVLWTSQHWILATGLAAATAVAEPAPRRGAVRGWLHAVNVRPWAVVVVLMLASVLLLPFFEVEAGWGEGTYYGDWIYGGLAQAIRTSTWVPVLLAIGFATGFNHYLLDRNVFRFSDPRVRVAARGLLGGRQS
jgi:hypothetical protein